MTDLNLESLAEEIQQDRDTIVVPQDLIEELPPEKKITRSLSAEIQQMTVGERLKLALKGNRDARQILIRDSSRVVQRFVLQNPRITDEEIVGLAKNRSIDRELLDLICRRKEWLANYQIKLALATNPKTPVVLALRLVPSLLPRDLRAIAKSKNVPGPICGLAKRLVIERSGGGPGSSGGH